MVESLLRDTDVPFGVAPDEFGAILPETDSTRGWSVVGPIIDAAGRSTFTDRLSGQRRSVADCAEVCAGLAFLPEDTVDGRIVDAAALIEEARAAHRAPGMA